MLAEASEEGRGRLSVPWRCMGVEGAGGGRGVLGQTRSHHGLIVRHCPAALVLNSDRKTASYARGQVFPQRIAFPGRR